MTRPETLWNPSQRAHMYRGALTGCPIPTIADGLGVPADAVATHLSRVKPNAQLTFLIDRARAVPPTSRSLSGGLIIDLLPVEDLVATATEHGSVRTKSALKALERAVDWVRSSLEADRDRILSMTAAKDVRADIAADKKRSSNRRVTS